AKLRKADKSPRPPGWNLSPRAVRDFVCGSKKPAITRKFYGDDVMIERAIIGLAGNRGLMLVGEPGTAKTMLSELLTAAITGHTNLTIQGTSGTTEDQIKYSWNYALLLAEGPSPKSLVPAPLYHGMKEGKIVRFEEITRCAPEIQDVLVSVLSDKTLMIPELGEEDGIVRAQSGFNLLATANTRDRGVHEMSAALKRRFNFETVHPIRNLSLEIKLVTEEAGKLLEESGVGTKLPPDVVELLVTAFHDLREGVTVEGIQVEKPSSVMSTAEAVSVALTAGLDAHYYGDGKMNAESVARHLATGVLKDDPEDVKKLKHYVDGVVRKRAESKGGEWSTFLKAKKWLP
ncbi:MAG: AAA family ATPase, partial [Verrucomicrobiota bacterium]